MSNVVEYLVKIRDLASGQWGKMANSADGAFTRMNTRMNKTGFSVDQLNRKISDLEKSRNISLNLSSIAQANREIEKLERKRDRLETTGRSGGIGGSAVGGLFRQALGLAGLGGGLYMIKDVMQKGMERQMNGVALQTLLGQANGAVVNAQLLDYAKKSIYGGEVFNEGKLMAASGIKANNIMPVMRMIGDIGMGNKERMQSLALAFSEASTRGSLNGMNEKMFMTGGLFNPLQQIHLMTGRSMDDLKKDMAKGKIGMDELVKAMEYATGPMGKYYKMTEKMQNSAAGKWTAFEGSISTLAGSIGLKLLPALGGIADFLTKVVNNSDALYLIANGIGVMTAAWGLYSIATTTAATKTALLEAWAMWPVALGVAVMGGVLYLCSGNDKLAGSTETTAQRITNATNLLRDSWTNTFYVLRVSALGFMSGLERIWNADKMALMGHPIDAMKFFFTGKTDADKKIDQLRSAHLNWAQGRQAAKDGYVEIDKKTGKPVKKSNPLDAFGLGGKYTPTPAGGGGLGDSIRSTANGISGGGVRNQTINIQKLGTDTITINTTNLKEGAGEIQRMFIELFNQVINSGNAAVSPQ